MAIVLVRVSVHVCERLIRFVCPLLHAQYVLFLFLYIFGFVHNSEHRVHTHTHTHPYRFACQKGEKLVANESLGKQMKIRAHTFIGHTSSRISEHVTKIESFIHIVHFACSWCWWWWWSNVHCKSAKS